MAQAPGDKKPVPAENKPARVAQPLKPVVAAKPVASPGARPATPATGAATPAVRPANGSRVASAAPPAAPKTPAGVRAVAAPTTVAAGVRPVPGHAAAAQQPGQAQGEEHAGGHEHATLQEVVQATIKTSPAWLTSMVVHICILLLLGLWFLPEVRKEIQNLVATSLEDTEEEEIEEIPVEEQVEDIEVETTVTDSQPVETDNVTDHFELSPNDDEPAPSVSVEIAEIGAESLPTTNATSEIGSIGGNGLEGRGEAARKALVASGGGSAESEKAVALALAWLAQHQNPDGSWSWDHTKGPCQGRCTQPGNITKGNISATGLALMPFLGAGQTHKQGKYQRQVQAGLYYLVNSQKAEAGGGSFMDEGTMYGHGICSIAICEAYAMTNDRNLMGPAQAALNFIVSAQDKVGGGWRYHPGQPGDTSVVGWQLMALKSGHMAYLTVPEATIQGISNFLNTVQTEGGYGYGYTAPGKLPGCTAIGLLCRMYLGWKKENPALQQGIEYLGQMGPSQQGNVYYNYYATQVMHHYGGEPWEKWNSVMRDFYVNSQSQNAHETGSWFFKGADHGAERGGRHYMTCMCCMTLEVYYRHLPVYRKQSTEDDFE
ncbi:MAG: terpene cyclase/mutase family protein [Pirellulales bacterium]|nr:terpene cyclase/mutase family protein [Pirellulales bacterium]